LHVPVGPCGAAITLAAEIGKQLVRLTKVESGPQTTVILLSAPKAVDYYPHIGFAQHPSAWTLR